jgi:hypothetical protein
MDLPCNTFYTHLHSVSGFMPQFVTKSAYCTGFPFGAITTSVCIIYCVKFTYTILLYLSNLKYKQYTLLVDVRNWLSSAIFCPYSLIAILSRYFIFLVDGIDCGSFIFIALSSFVTMTISVDCIEAVSFTTYLNNEFGIKIAPYSNKCIINEIRVSIIHIPFFWLSQTKVCRRQYLYIFELQRNQFRRYKLTVVLPVNFFFAKYAEHWSSYCSFKVHEVNPSPLHFVHLVSSKRYKMK